MNVSKNFDYIQVGGQCIYDTNVVWTINRDTFVVKDANYVINSGVFIFKFISSSYITINFDTPLDATLIEYLEINVGFDTFNDTTIKVEWFTNPPVDEYFTTTFSDNIGAAHKSFKYKRFILSAYSGWREQIVSIKILFPDYTGILYISSLKFLSSKFFCSNSSCNFKQYYVHKCIGSYYSKTFVANKKPYSNIYLDEHLFVVEVNEVSYKYKVRSGHYTLTGLVNNLNKFLDSLPVGDVYFKIQSNVEFVTTCTINNLIYCESFRVLGFFNGDTSIAYSVDEVGYIESNYIDVAGKLVGIYSYTKDFFLDVKQLNVDTKLTDVLSEVQFKDKLVLFKSTYIVKAGVYNKIIICGKVTTASKIIIYRNYKNTFVKDIIYNIHDNVTGKYEFTENMWLNKGDVIAYYNVSIKTPVVVKDTVNYYYSVDGIPNTIPFTEITKLVAASVGVAVVTEIENITVIPITFISGQLSYIDGLYFSEVVTTNSNVDLSSFLEVLDSYIRVGCDDRLLDVHTTVANNSVIITNVDSTGGSYLSFLDLEFLYRSDFTVTNLEIRFKSDFPVSVIDDVVISDCSTSSCKVVQKVPATTTSNVFNVSWNISNIDLELYTVRIHSKDRIEYPNNKDIATYSVSTQVVLPRPEPYKLYILLNNEYILLDGSNYVVIGQHIDTLEMYIDIFEFSVIDLSRIRIISNRVPYCYDINKSTGNIVLFNTHLRDLYCKLIDVKTVTESCVVEYIPSDFPIVVYRHDSRHFNSSYFKYNKYKLYSLVKLLYDRTIFETDKYIFTCITNDWFTPYDYDIALYDGTFLYENSALYVKQVVSNTVRWLNFINSCVFKGDVSAEVSFDFIGSATSYVLLGIIFFDRNYNNFCRFYKKYDVSGGFGVEYKLHNMDESIVSTFVGGYGSHTILSLRRDGSTLTIGYIVNQQFITLTSLSFVDSDIYIALTTMYRSDSAIGTYLFKIQYVSISYIEKISGCKTFYSIDDINTVVYNGYIIDSINPMLNIDHDLSLPGFNVVNKFVYIFGNIKLKFLKFVAVNEDSVDVTEIHCFLDNELLHVDNEYVSYNSNYVSGPLESESSFLLDGCILNPSLSYTISTDGVTLGSVGVEFDEIAELNKVCLYYIYNTSNTAAPRLLYSYDNMIYYDVFDNFSLFTDIEYTELHYLFNEYSGYRCLNEIRYIYTSENDFDTDFSKVCYPVTWTEPVGYTCEPKGVRFTSSSIYSNFYVDGDFDIDVFYDDISGVTSSSYIYLYIYFINSTSYSYTYVAHNIYNKRIYYRNKTATSYSYRSKLRSYQGGLRLSRRGTKFYWKYREGMTTWQSVNNSDYGSDYKYPVSIRIYVANCTATVQTVNVSSGRGIGEEDICLLENYYTNSIFVRGVYFPTINYNCCLHVVNDKLYYFKPNSFLALLVYFESIPSSYAQVVCKYCNNTVCVVEQKIAYILHLGYSCKFLCDSTISSGDFTNSFIAVSIKENRLNYDLLQVCRNSVLFAYNSGSYTNIIFDTHFDNEHTGLTLTGPGTFSDKGVFNLEYTSVLKNDSSIISTNRLVIECSVDFYTYSYHYSSQRYRAIIGISNHDSTSPFNTSHSTVYILHVEGRSYLNVYIDGYDKGKLCDIKLNYTYLFSISYLEDKVVISWNGLTNGFREFNCRSCYDTIYVWSGSYTGIYQAVSSYRYYYRLHRFLCRRAINYINVIKDYWLDTVELSDSFGGSDGRLPNGLRWDISGDPRTFQRTLLLRSSYDDIITSKYFLNGDFNVVINYKGLEYTSSSYSGFYVVLHKVGEIFTDIPVEGESIFIGFVSEAGIEIVVGGNTTFYTGYTLTNGSIKILRIGVKLYFYFYNAGIYELLISYDVGLEYRYLSIKSNGDAAVVYIDEVNVECANAVSNLSPTFSLQLEPFFDQRNNYYSYNRLTLLPIGNILDNDSTFNIDFNVFTSYNTVWWIFSKYLVNVELFNINSIIDNNTLAEAISNGGLYYIFPGVYTLDSFVFTKDIILVGVGDYHNIKLNINNYNRFENNVFVYFYNISIFNYRPDNWSGYFFRLDGATVVLDNCYCKCVNYASAFYIRSNVNAVYFYTVKVENISYLFIDSTYFSFYPFRSVLKVTKIMAYHNDNIKSYIYVSSDSTYYEPIVTDKIIVWIIVNNNRCMCYCGIESIDLEFRELKYEYISIGNNFGGLYIFTSSLPFYFFSLNIDNRFTDGELWYKAVIDTLRVDSNFITSNEVKERILEVNTSSIPMYVYYNDNFSLNFVYHYNSYATATWLRLCEGFNGLIDEFIYDIQYKSNEDILRLYEMFVSKFNYKDYKIDNSSCKCRYYIDLGKSIGVGSLLLLGTNNFSQMLYYKDDIDDPLMLTEQCDMSVCRWVVFEDSITSVTKTVGAMSLFPSINSKNVFEYVGRYDGYDVVVSSVIQCTSDVITNIRYLEYSYKANYSDYCIIKVTDNCELTFKYIGSIYVNKIIIKSGIKIGSTFQGMLTGVTIEVGDRIYTTTDVINSKISLDINKSVESIITIKLISTTKVDEISVDDVYISGYYAFIEYISILYGDIDAGFNDNICFSFEFLEKFNVASIDYDTTCSTLNYYIKDAAVNDNNSLFVVNDWDNINTNIRSICTVADTYTVCKLAIYAADVVVSLDNICSVVDMWSVELGDINIGFNRYYVDGDNTGSIELSFYKDTEFDVLSYSFYAVDVSDIGITDNIRLVLNSSIEIDSLYFRLGSLHVYFEWELDIRIGTNVFYLTQHDSNLTKISYGRVKIGLKLSDITIDRVGFRGIVFTSDGALFISNVGLEPVNDIYTLSSKLDALEIPFSSTITFLIAYLTFESFWGISGKVFDEYVLNKAIISFIGNDFKMSLVNDGYGTFILNVLVESVGYKNSFKNRLSITFTQGTICDVVCYVLIENGQVSVKVVFNGSILFYEKLGITMNDLTISFITLGGGAVYLYPTTPNVSLCGHILAFRVNYGNGTEYNVDMSQLYIDLGDGYIPLITELPVDLGLIPSGGYKQFPVKNHSGSSNVDINVLWSIFK